MIKIKNKNKKDFIEEFLEYNKLSFKIYDINVIYKYNIFFIGISKYNPKYNEEEQGYIIFEEDAKKILNYINILKILMQEKRKILESKKMFLNM